MAFYLSIVVACALARIKVNVGVEIMDEWLYFTAMEG